MLNKARTHTAVTACVPRRRGRPARDEGVMPREEILARAFAAFAAEGYDGVSLRALAAACDVSDSLLHHHFGSKQQLWREAADSVFRPIYDRLSALLDALAASGDEVVILQSNLPQAVKLMAAQPLALQFLFREGEGDDERGRYLRETWLHPYLDRLDALFLRAQQQGHYRAVSAAARHALVFGLLRSLVIPGVLRRELEPALSTRELTDRYIDEAVSVLYDGLLLPPGTTP